MTRLTARLLAGSVALMLLSACTRHSTPTEAARISSTPVSSALTSSAPTSAGRAKYSASASAVPCDRAASGRLGQPEGGDKVLFTVRLSSYWVQSQGVVPLAVVYANGSVAVSQDNVKVSKRPINPLLPLLGGAFSACAVQQLKDQFEAFTRADFGDLRVADAAEAVITRVGQSSSEDNQVVHLESADFGLSHAVLQPAQSAARRTAERWLAQVLHVTAGVRLPMDRIAVVGFRGTVPYDDTTPSMPWQGPALANPLTCRALVGKSADQALASVRDSFRGRRFTGSLSSSYVGPFIMGKQGQHLTVTPLPPGITCGPP